MSVVVSIDPSGAICPSDVEAGGRYSGLRQIGGELIHCPAPAPAHAVVTGSENFALFFGRVVRGPADGELGLAAADILKREGRKHLQGPVRRHRMTGNSAGLIRKRI